MSGNYNKSGKPPAPFSSANYRIATGNMGKKRPSKTAQNSAFPVTAASSEFKPGSAQTALIKNSMRASSNMHPRGTAESSVTGAIEKSKLNIVAKKRPPPMNIGYNGNGIEQKR